MWCSSPFVIVWYDRVYDMIYDTTIKQWNDGLPRVPTTPLLTRLRSDAANVHDGGGGACVGYDTIPERIDAHGSPTYEALFHLLLSCEDGSWRHGILLEQHTCYRKSVWMRKNLSTNHISHWLVLVVVVVVGRCHMCDVTVIWSYCHGESRNEF